MACAMYGYYNRNKIEWVSDSRRAQDLAPPPNVPANSDCSAFATWCYKSAGAPDPSGFGYRQIGSTYSQIGRGSRVASKGQLKAGDLVFYSNPAHVAIYVGQGKVVSHGSDPGPRLEEVGYRPVSAMRNYF